jgi:hypothetical protein
MKKADLPAEILEECLRRIQQGEPVDGVLADYASMDAELRPLLEAARLLSKPILVPQSARARSQARFLAAAQQARTNKIAQAQSRLAFDLRQPVLLWRWLPVRVVAALALVLVLLTSGFYGVNQVAAQSIPGDRFYSVKRVVEQVQLQFAPNIATRLKLETEFSQRRKDEVEHLIQYSRYSPVIFTGFAAQEGPGRWEVNGIPVDLTPEQEIQLAASQKLLLQVHGRVQSDGTVLVEDAVPHSFNFQGKVEEFDSQAWMIDGVKFAVRETTRISGNPQVGSAVNVVALEDDDDTLEAVSVEVQNQEPAGDSSQKKPSEPSQKEDSEDHEEEEDD